MKKFGSTEFISFKGHFLIAMPGLNDPFFGRSVICICEHTPEGALGMVINHQHSLIKTSQIFKEFNLNPERVGESPLCIGGPVQLDKIFVLHGSPFKWQGTLKIESGIALSNTFDILEGISKGEGPKQFLMILGCAGWGPGQLEKELMENTWLTTPLSLDVVFNVSVEDKWNEAVKSAGIDPVLLTSTAGHA